MDLTNTVALVAGASRGIGRAIAFALARAGVTIIAPYHDWPEDCRTMAEEFAALGAQHLAVPIDLRSPSAIAQLLEQVASRFGRLDILVNNIERGGMPVVHGEYTPEQWDLEMETTLRAKRWLFHHSLPLLKRAPAGAVLNISSIAGICGRSGPAGLIFNDGYAAASRAVSSFTEIWARLAAPTVRVNELMVGFIETRHAEKTRGWGLLREEDRQNLVGHILLGRTGTLEDVVRAALFLIRDATYMTGTVLRLDGGYVLGGEPVPPMPAGVV